MWQNLLGCCHHCCFAFWDIFANVVSSIFFSPSYRALIGFLMGHTDWTCGRWLWYLFSLTSLVSSSSRQFSLFRGRWLKQTRHHMRWNVSARDEHVWFAGLFLSWEEVCFTSGVFRLIPSRVSRVNAPLPARQPRVWMFCLTSKITGFIQFITSNSTLCYGSFKTWPISCSTLNLHVQHSSLIQI